MLERYARPEMQAVWSLQNRYRKWLEIELLVCEAGVRAGEIPLKAQEAIRQRASFSVARVAEIEAEVQHDLIAFLRNVAENVGPEARYLHLGLTSSDIKDTALALQMREAMDIILADVGSVISVLKTQTFRYRDTIMIGRTHGTHAEPITLGFMFALWAFEMHRNLKRLERARETISCGKLSGAVGTYATVDPETEQYVCQRLGLTPAGTATQIIQRDRHAEYVSALALTATSLEKFAVDIRNLQRTEIGEVEEPMRAGQRGSSAMPHKRNPVITERISGLARIVRGYLLPAMESMVLWNERDISHSSVERITLPGATILLDYMLTQFASVVQNVELHPDQMLRNLRTSGGLYASQRVLMTLVDKGLAREEAYELVWRCAKAGREGKGDFSTLLMQDKTVCRHLSKEEIEALFDIDWYVRNLDTIFARLATL